MRPTRNQLHSWDAAFAERSSRFQYFSDVTTYRFNMDIGIDCPRPSHNPMRIYQQLGLVNPKSAAPIAQGHTQTLRLAAHTGHSTRVIEYVLEANTQAAVKAIGMAGLYIKGQPRCTECRLTALCPKLAA